MDESVRIISPKKNMEEDDFDLKFAYHQHFGAVSSSSESDNEEEFLRLYGKYKPPPVPIDPNDVIIIPPEEQNRHLFNNENLPSSTSYRDEEGFVQQTKRRRKKNDSHNVNQQVNKIKECSKELNLSDKKQKEVEHKKRSRKKVPIEDVPKNSSPRNIKNGVHIVKNDEVEILSLTQSEFPSHLHSRTCEVQKVASPQKKKSAKTKSQVIITDPVLPLGQSECQNLSSSRTNEVQKELLPQTKKSKTKRQKVVSPPQKKSANTKSSAIINNQIPFLGQSETPNLSSSRSYEVQKVSLSQKEKSTKGKNPAILTGQFSPLGPSEFVSLQSSRTNDVQKVSSRQKNKSTKTRPVIITEQVSPLGLSECASFPSSRNNEAQKIKSANKSPVIISDQIFSLRQSEFPCLPSSRTSELQNVVSSQKIKSTNPVIITNQVLPLGQSEYPSLLSSTFKLNEHDFPVLLNKKIRKLSACSIVPTECKIEDNKNIPENQTASNTNEQDFFENIIRSLIPQNEIISNIKWIEPIDNNIKSSITNIEAKKPTTKEKKKKSNQKKDDIRNVVKNHKTETQLIKIRNQQTIENSPISNYLETHVQGVDRCKFEIESGLKLINCMAQDASFNGVNFYGNYSNSELEHSIPSYSKNQHEMESSESIPLFDVENVANNSQFPDVLHLSQSSICKVSHSEKLELQNNILTDASFDYVNYYSYHSNSEAEESFSKYLTKVNNHSQSNEIQNVTMSITGPNFNVNANNELISAEIHDIGIDTFTGEEDMLVTMGSVGVSTKLVAIRNVGVNTELSIEQNSINISLVVTRNIGVNTELTSAEVDMSTDICDAGVGASNEECELVTMQNVGINTRLITLQNVEVNTEFLKKQNVGVNTELLTEQNVGVNTTLRNIFQSNFSDLSIIDFMNKFNDITKCDNKRPQSLQLAFKLTIIYLMFQICLSLITWAIDNSLLIFMLILYGFLLS